MSGVRYRLYVLFITAGLLIASSNFVRDDLTPSEVLRGVMSFVGMFTLFYLLGWVYDTKPTDQPDANFGRQQEKP